MERGDVFGEEGAVWDDEVVAQALSEFLLALCQDDASHLGLQLLQLMRELREVKGSDNFSNFPTLYKKDKERAKKQVLYVFSPPFAFINFFLDNLLKFIVNLQPVIKINKPKQ